MAKEAITKDYKTPETSEGKIGESFDYLKYTDPTSYYYQKFKSQDNRYLNDQMWNIAAARGESNQLTLALLNQPANNEYFDTWQDWQDYATYEDYMFALSIPTLDDTDKTREDRVFTLDDGTEYNFGSYTDKEWAIHVFEENKGHWEAEKLEEDKRNRNFWEHLGQFAKVALLDIPLRITTGTLEFIGDIWNNFEAVANMFFNWSGDEDIGARLNYAYQDGNWFKDLAELTRATASVLEYDTMLVNSVTAYEAGYRGWGEGDNLFEIAKNTNVDAISQGQNWFGRAISGVSESIGYMLPSIGFSLIPGVGAFSNLLFYSGVFAGNVSDTLNTAKMRGISYKQLNSGEVLANAALKTAAEWAVEKVLGKILGSTRMDKLRGYTDKGLIKTGVSAPTKVGSAARVAGSFAKEAFQEGLEEFLQDSATGLIDLAFGQNSSLLSEQFKQQGEDALDINNLVQSFTLGALTSLVIGTVSSFKYIPSKNRAYGINEEGKAYKLGFFQTMDYNNSLQKMLEWKDTLDSSKASSEAKYEAGLKLATAYDVMSKMFKSMSSEDLVKANKVLISQAALKNAKESDIMKLSSAEYGEKLLSDFKLSGIKAQLKYVNEQLVKNAAKKKAGSLKDSLVTKFKNIFGMRSKVDEESNIDTKVQETVISFAQAAKAEAIVSHDGNIITRSGDVIFVPDSLLINGDVKSILEGIAREDVTEAVKETLTDSQKKMILSQYNTITKSNGTIEDAIIALLFDKSFYCKMLLLSGERNYKQDSINILLSIDKIVKNKLSPEVTKGNITEGAFNKLMERVQRNMIGGLINFCTTYARIDLNVISSEVLSDELKNGINEIRNNANVMMSISLDTMSTQKESFSEKQKKELDKILNSLSKDKFAAKYVEQIKTALNSSDFNTRADAIVLLRRLLVRDFKTSTISSKLIYLPTIENVDKVNIDLAKSEVENFIGINFDDFIKGNIDATKLTQEFNDFIKSSNVNLRNEVDRIRLLDQLLFNYSNNTFALDINGSIVKVFEQNKVIKKEYLGEDGVKKLKDDIENGKVKTLRDIFKVDLSDKLNNIKVKLFSSRSDGAQGIYNPDKSRISINKNLDSDKFLKVLLHETTHATFNSASLEHMNKDGRRIVSADYMPADFERMSDDRKLELMYWIANNRPMFYSYCLEHNITFGHMVYMLTEGHITAEARTSTMMNHSGFYVKVLNNDMVGLKLPDGTSIPIIENSEEETYEDKLFRLKFYENKILQLQNALYYAGIDIYNTPETDSYYLPNIDNITDKFIREYKDNISHKQDIMTDKINELNDKYQDIINGKINVDIATKNKISQELNSLIESRNQYATEVHAIDALYESRESFNKAMQNYKSLKKEIKSLKSKKEKSDQASMSIESDGKNRVFINANMAKGNFLAYFKRKGVDYAHKNIIRFVSAIKKEDFNKLPKVLQDHITNGTLNMNAIYKFVGPAKSLDDYTFKLIAKHIFNNSYLAKLTFEDFKYLRDNIEDLAAVTFVLNAIANKDASGKFNKVNGENVGNVSEENLRSKSIDEIKKIVNDITNSEDPEIIKHLEAGRYFATSLKIKSEKAKHYTMAEDVHPELGLNILLLNHYDGTLNSLKYVENASKKITSIDKSTQEISVPEGVDPDKFKSNIRWKTRAYGIEDDSEIYQSTNAKEMLLNYFAPISQNKAVAEIVRRHGDIDETEARNTYYNEIAKLADKFQRQYEAKINQMSDEQLESIYLKLVPGLSSKTDTSKEIEHDLETIKVEGVDRKSLQRQAYNLGRTIGTRIAGLKRRYNSLSETTKKYIDPNNKYKLKSGYGNVSDAELNEMIKAFQEDAKKLRTNIRKEELAAETRQKTKDYANKRAKEIAEERAKLKEQEKEIAKKEKEIAKKEQEIKSLREKIKAMHKLEVKETNVSFTSGSKANDLTKKLVATEFSKRAMSKIKGMSNEDEVVVSGKEFFTNNAEIFAGATLSEITDTALWFLDARLNNATAEEIKQFETVRFLTLGYILSQAKQGGYYEGLNNNIRQRIENAVKGTLSSYGSGLRNYQHLMELIDPIGKFVSASMEIDGVEIGQDLKTKFFDAIMSNNIDKIDAVQKEIWNYVDAHSKKGRSILRKIISARSMAMLSSPMTWLRNKVSNMALKRINKLADKIGNKIFTGKHVTGQLKLDKPVTTEIQKFITDNFIDNKLFDSFVDKISKYNPSDIIDTKHKKQGYKPTKEQVMVNLVVKAMYSQYYNENMFKSKFMSDLHGKLMKMLSDDSYVRESAIRTFGKILAEKNYNLSEFNMSGTERKEKKSTVADDVMNDFANALGMAMSEYMHSDNMFNNIEAWISQRSELGWFAYKLLMPYAASSWNWFKQIIKLSPIGLARSIVKLARLEQNVQRQQELFNQGKSQISGELAEYMIRREFGQGVIGTISFGLGMLLAAFGFVRLEDDDYGTPKLKFGNLVIDVSQIFGNSSLLAGAGMITQIQKNGMSLSSVEKGLNTMFDVWIDQMPIMDIVQMDMYSNGSFSVGKDQLANIALSFIPNLSNFVAGFTYTGTLRKTNFFEKAIAKIPFMGNFLEKKVDPYTGENGGWIDILNRVVPYFSLDIASQNESNSSALGLTKKELNGKYKINDENFNVSGKNLTAINEAYGKWNAQDLTKFYNDEMTVKIKVNNKYVNLKYSQLDNEQRRKAVNTIMSNNAELAKIVAWTNSGNQYYASAEIYKKLIAAGFKTNVYRGTKGFVKK